MIEFILNNEKITTAKPTGYLLLDLIRYDASLTGTKIGCREGDCGACIVLIGELMDGQMKYTAVTSCLTPLGNVHGKHVVTIEGLNMESLSPPQQYMIDESGTQCGFCTVGFVVSMSGYCMANASPAYEEAIASIDGNICRCTGYKSIERAARRLTEALKNKDKTATIDWLVANKFIPSYFSGIKTRLKEIEATPRSVSNGVALVGGGTDLYVQKPEDLMEHNIGTIRNEQRFIQVKDKVCTIGGGSTVTDLLESKAMHQIIPGLTDYVKLVSSTPIRNISTLAGNFVNASPIGDFTIFFLALNAKITLTELDRSITIFLKDFYKGYKDIDKSAGEIISTLSFEVPESDAQFNFEKISKRENLDIASVNTAAQLVTDKDIIKVANISAGGVGPIPYYLKETSSYLIGKEVSPSMVKTANKIAQEEISPISDVRGSAEYKRLALRQLLYAHFIKFFPNQISMGLLR